MDQEKSIIWNSNTARLILICLNEKEVDFAGNVTKKIDATWCDVLNKFKDLERESLIEFVENRGKKYYPFVYKSKRTKYHRLTKKGKRIVELLLKIRTELEN